MVVGTNDRKHDRVKGIVYYSQFGIKHPDLDIALFKMRTKIGFIPNRVQPIKLSTIPVANGTRGLHAGWGYGNDKRNLLKYIEVEVFSKKTYLSVFSTTGGGGDGGDSGGPLVVGNMIIGVQHAKSWDKKLGLIGIFAEVYDVKDWIHDIISKP